MKGSLPLFSIKKVESNFRFKSSSTENLEAVSPFESDFCQEMLLYALSPCQAPCQAPGRESVVCKHACCLLGTYDPDTGISSQLHTLCVIK